MKTLEKRLKDIWELIEIVVVCFVLAIILAPFFILIRGAGALLTLFAPLDT